MTATAQTRYNVEAPALKKRRRPNNWRNKKLPTADIDQYNNRQVMECKETLQRKTSGGGIGSATTVQLVERAQRTLPPATLAAYMTQEHGEMADVLIAHIAKKFRRQAKRWQYNKTKADHCQLMAALVVDAWQSPAKYWRPSGAPYISSFASAMQCDRKTWTKTWKPIFISVAPTPANLYHEGRYLMEQ